MRRHAMPEMKEGGVNVTPLIDIVMCLIIFFMLVTKIGVDTGKDNSIHVPASFLAGKIDMGNTLTINVNNGPDIPGDQQPSINFINNGQKEELKIHSDNPSQALLLDTLKYRKSLNSEFKVVIRADENTKYQYLEPVLNVCTQAGVNYDFATHAPGD